MRLQIVTFIFLAFCLALLAVYAFHEQAQTTTTTPPPSSSDTTSSQYRL